MNTVLYLAIFLIFLFAFRRMFNFVFNYLILFGIVYCIFYLFLKDPRKSGYIALIITLFLSLTYGRGNIIEGMTDKEDKGNIRGGIKKEHRNKDKNDDSDDESDNESEDESDNEANKGQEIIDEKPAQPQEVESEDESDNKDDDPENFKNPKSLKSLQKDTFAMMGTLKELQSTIETLAPTLNQGKKVMKALENFKFQ